MKNNKTLNRTILFAILIFFAALIGQGTAHGYIHPADPIIMLAAMLLPTPYALAGAGLASVAADLIKGYYLLAPATLIIKMLTVLAVKGLLTLKPAQKHPELMASAAALVPVPGYYLAEAIYQLCIGKGAAAFTTATVTLQKNLVQGVAGILVFIFIYDIYKGIQAGRQEVRRMKAAEQQKEDSAE